MKGHKPLSLEPWLVHVFQARLGNEDSVLAFFMFRSCTVLSLVKKSIVFSTDKSRYMEVMCFMEIAIVPHAYFI